MSTPNPQGSAPPSGHKTKMRLAAAMLVLGLLTTLGSCTPFGLSLYRGLNAHTAYRADLALGETYASPLIEVDTTQHVQLAVKIALETPSVVLERDASGEKDFEAQYLFPVNYTLEDEEGRILHSEHTRVVWNAGKRSTTDKTVNSRGGSLTVQSSFDKLDLAGAGRIRVRVDVAPDTTYAASAHKVELLVYDQVYRHGPMIALGFMLLAAGLLILLVGTVWLIVQSTRQTAVGQAATGGAVETTGQAASSGGPLSEHQARDWALACHLSAYAGLVVPFGGLVAPIVIWAVGRERHPMIERHGREVVNFRISLYLYYFVALILCLVLIGFVILPFLVLADLILPALGAIKASNGQDMHYPLTIRFLKDEA